MKIIAKVNFKLGDTFYEKGDEVEVKNRDTLVLINEKGFIEPLTPKQIQEFDKTKIIKKEE